MKVRRPNIPEIKVTELDAIDMENKAPFPVRVCNKLWLSCSFCKQGTPHPSSQESEWSSKGWDGTRTETKKETGETNLLSHWDLTHPQSKPKLTTDIDKLAIDKLHIGQDRPKKKQVKITDSLIPLPMSEEEGKATMGEMTKEPMEGLTEMEKRFQLEEEEYALHQKDYVRQLSNEEESDTESDYLDYNHFD